MHLLRELSRGPGSHVLPGIILLVLGTTELCLWEIRRLTGRQAGDGLGRLIVFSGIILGFASCVLMAARFIWVA